ncbi:MAG: Transposase [Glomeribacter sp. 1016415]|nr:Transposase [Glomeribacter sp. 1016415]
MIHGNTLLSVRGGQHQFEETLHSDIAAVQEELTQTVRTLNSTDSAPRRGSSGRQTLPEHLPRVEHRHEPESCMCGGCGQAPVKVGEDISEQLDIEPIRFFVHRHIRPQYACRACETMTAAPIAAAVIDGGLATPGLLSWVVTSKYLDHLPLYRLEEIAARQGVKLARSSLADWVGRVGVALQPLADRLAELLRQRLVLHADETPVAQLAPGTGKTKRAYLWAYRSGEFDEGPPIVVFDYQTSREGSHVRDFLPDWKGHLVVDDYSGYKASFKKGVTEVGCNAHARRKFFDLHAANQSSIAAQALFYIAELYEIEKRAKSLNVAQREALRLKETVPKLNAYHSWLVLTRTTVADGSSTARAIDYSLKRWESLSLFASTGLLPIDNNPVENAIRPIALGKKNWLFTGSERAGCRAASIQSLLATAKLNGIEPVAWLTQTLEKLPSCPHRLIDQLLPLRHSSPDSSEILVSMD